MPSVVVARVVYGNEVFQGVPRHVALEHRAVQNAIVDGFADQEVVRPLGESAVDRSSDVIIRHHEEALGSVRGLGKGDAMEILQVAVGAQFVHVPNSIIHKARFAHDINKKRVAFGTYKTRCVY